MKKIALTLILIISVQCIIAQPIIGLGHSKTFITTHMQASPGWIMTSKTKSEITYSDGKTEFTYSFMKDEPSRASHTCTQCIATFTDSAARENYLNAKVSAWKLRPHPDMMNLIVMTDLFTDTIKAVVVGNRSVVFNY